MLRPCSLIFATQRDWLPSTAPWRPEILVGRVASTRMRGSRRSRRRKKYRRTFSEDEVEPLAKGTGEGILYGGCLSLLCASLGTPYEIRTRGTILFLEDLNEPPYRIDRMLMQLKLAGKLKGVKGIVFGEMRGCNQRGAADYTLQQVVLRVLGDLRVPIAFGLRSGHVSCGNFTLPFGVAAKLSVGKAVTLEYEPAVGKPQAGEGAQRMTRKHVHLIGICGTAMASLAGMLKERGFQVTGSDNAAYPPMSDFLASLSISVSQPFSESNLQPRPDLVVVGNAISRGNSELEYVLDHHLSLAIHAAGPA